MASGTGKTVTLVECALQLLAAYPAARLLLCAPQNYSAGAGLSLLLLLSHLCVAECRMPAHHVHHCTKPWKDRIQATAVPSLRQPRYRPAVLRSGGCWHDDSRRVPLQRPPPPHAAGKPSCPAYKLHMRCHYLHGLRVNRSALQYSFPLPHEG